jgi:hypothetical protein
MFRCRARLIRLLGEELIGDDVMAIVELVKSMPMTRTHRWSRSTTTTCE